MDVAHDLWEDEDFKGRVIEEPSVWGVQDLGIDGVVMRVALKTAPLEQWSVAREMRERIKARFDYEKIEIPFPQHVVWHRDRSAGTAGARRGGHGVRRGSLTLAGRGTGHASAASSVMSVARSAWLTGQPSLAASASFTNSSSDMPST